MGKLVSGIVDDNAITQIYKEYNPAFNNLYTIEMYSVSFDKESDMDIEISDYIKYHAVDVSFDDESLNLSRNSVTKNFQLNANDQYTWPSMLKIQWREADDWKVKRYHENWVSKFYDKYRDCFISYDQKDAMKLYKTIKVTLPYVKIGDKYEERSIYFKKVLPKNIGSFHFNWSTTGEIINHKMSYYVKEWNWSTSRHIKG